jgi:hypothetical protein
MFRALLTLSLTSVVERTFTFSASSWGWTIAVVIEERGSARICTPPIQPVKCAPDGDAPALTVPCVPAA